MFISEVLGATGHEEEHHHQGMDVYPSEEPFDHRLATSPGNSDESYPMLDASAGQARPPSTGNASTTTNNVIMRPAKFPEYKH